MVLIYSVVVLKCDQQDQEVVYFEMLSLEMAMSSSTLVILSIL